MKILSSPGKTTAENNALILQAINSIGEKMESVRRELVAQIESTKNELTTFKLSMPDAYVPRREHTERWEGEGEKFAQLSARQEQIETRMDQVRNDMTAVRSELQTLREDYIRWEKADERSKDQSFTRNQGLILAAITLGIGWVLSHITIVFPH